MKTYKYILLDWDGNLAKTLDIWLEASRTALQRRGVHPSDEEIASSFGNFTTRWPTWGVNDVHAAIDEAYMLAKDWLPEVELYPDALEVLEALHAKGKKMALITSSRLESVDHLLKKYDLTAYFQAVITAEDIAHHKPHPEPLEKALQKLGGDKAAAIIIGDSDKDIGAAKNMGIDSILFYPPEHKKFYDLATLRELGPTHIVSDFREVLKLV